MQLVARFSTWSQVPVTVIASEVSCPNCGTRLKVNPFVISANWGSIAKVWKAAQSDR
jgi:hypothetical protein